MSILNDANVVSKNYLIIFYVLSDIWRPRNKTYTFSIQRCFAYVFLDIKVWYVIKFYSIHVKNITTNRQSWISLISLICWANLSDFILCIWWYIKPKNTTDMFSIQKYIISQFSTVTTSSHYPQNTKNKSRQMHGTLTNNDILVF